MSNVPSVFSVLAMVLCLTQGSALAGDRPANEGVKELAKLSKLEKKSKKKKKSLTQKKKVKDDGAPVEKEKTEETVVEEKTEPKIEEKKEELVEKKEEIKEEVKEEKTEIVAQEEKFLSLDELKDSLKNFEIALEKDGLSFRAFGTFPEACKDKIKVRQPKAQPVGARAGFIFADQGGFLDCVKEKKDSKLVGLGTLPNTRLDASVLDGEASLIEIGIFRYDHSNERDPEIFEPFLSVDGEKLTYETAAFLQQKRKSALEDKKIARIEKLKKNVESCQGSLEGLKIAQKSLDELLDIGGITKDEHERVREQMASNELLHLKKKAVKVNAETVDELLELLAQYAARYPEKHDALAGVYSALAQSFLSKEGATEQEVLLAQQILAEAKDVLTDLSPKGEKVLAAAKIALQGELVMASARNGLSQNPFLSFQIQAAQLEATNNVMRYCGSGGMMGFGLMGGMNGFGMPQQQKQSALCESSYHSMQLIAQAYPTAISTDYMRYSMWQQMQMQSLMAMQNPMMFSGGMNVMIPQGQMTPGMYVNPMLTGYGTMMSNPMGANQANFLR